MCDYMYVCLCVRVYISQLSGKLFEDKMVGRNEDVLILQRE